MAARLLFRVLALATALGMVVGAVVLAVLGDYLIAVVLGVVGLVCAGAWWAWVCEC